MRTKLASLNHCAVPFLSRAAVNLGWYYCSMYIYSQITIYNICTSTYFQLCFSSSYNPDKTIFLKHQIIYNTTVQKFLTILAPKMLGKRILKFVLFRARYSKLTVENYKSFGAICIGYVR